MSVDGLGSYSEIVIKILKLLGITGIEQLGDFLNSVRKLISGLSHEGVYEVLDFETFLELKDRRGEKAHVSKREKVRYLQNNICSGPQKLDT